MKPLFILGRNVKLSIAELKAVFGERDFVLEKNAVLIELDSLEKDVIDKLGGTIAIGEVICNINELEDKEIYFGSKNKFNYVVWNFSKNTDAVSDILKRKFKEEWLKTTEKKINEDMELQDRGRAKILRSKKLVNEQYFVFEEEFGKIIQTCDYTEIEERDMKKPVRREALSISPRLAKIMINLSGVKKGEKLVDSFCGIGVILQEALLKGIKVIGIDKDKKAIEGAEKNFKWFNFSKEDYKLINQDSSKVKIEQTQVLVAEPDLGETLKHIPSTNQARRTLSNFEDLIIQVINNLKPRISGKIVLTAPLIKTSKGRLGCNFEEVVSKTKLRLAEGFPIQEFRKNQIVGREIVVLEQ
ncbi:MAG: methyltransferase domain-containing protein [archaeon]